MDEIEMLACGYGLVEGPRVDRDDSLYFSDVHKGGVHRRQPDGTIETVVPKRRGVGGIALHTDGGVVISGRNICHVRDGETRIVFAPDAPGLNDLFVDAAGRVICAHDYDDGAVTERRLFVQRDDLSPDGAEVGRVEVPARMVTSLCFGGTDRRDLYIVTGDNTADPIRGGTIFRTRAETPGCLVTTATV